jgi:hypothetical protein
MMRLPGFVNQSLYEKVTEPIIGTVQINKELKVVPARSRQDWCDTFADMCGHGNATACMVASWMVPMCPEFGE